MIPILGVWCEEEITTKCDRAKMALCSEHLQRLIRRVSAPELSVGVRGTDLYTKGFQAL